MSQELEVCTECYGILLAHPAITSGAFPNNYPIETIQIFSVGFNCGVTLQDLGKDLDQISARDKSSLSKEQSWKKQRWRCLFVVDEDIEREFDEWLASKCED
jgi:hypothetical protein